MQGDSEQQKRVIKSKDRNRGSLHGSQVDVRGVAKTVKVADLRPNTWNYNTQSEQVFQKLVTSIRRHGFTKPVVVRTALGPVPYEILDGEHRWRAVQVLGGDTITIVDLGEVEDSKARELTIILNELGGRPDDVRLGDLLREINAMVPLEELAQVMPFSESELDTYMGAMSFDFAGLSGGDTRPPKTEEELAAQPMRSSKKSVRMQWGGLQAYDVEKLLDEAKAATGLSTNEDVVIAAVRALVAKGGL